MLTYEQLAHIQQILQRKLDYLYNPPTDDPGMAFIILAEFMTINTLEDMVWDMMRNYPAAHFECG